MAEPSLIDRFTWRSRDQAVLAALAASALAALALAWWWHGGLEGELVEIDQRSPQSYRFLVDVNTAPAAELALLPGIGPTLARRIVDYRQTHGPFASYDDLLAVSGIGRLTLEKLKPHLAPLDAP